MKTKFALAAILLAATALPALADGGVVTLYSADGLHDGDPSWYGDQFAAFTEKTGIKINAVRLRRDDDKVFKGSVFVEFKTIEDMKKFMELEDKPEWNGQKMVLIDPKAEVRVCGLPVGPRRTQLTYFRS